ncbi:MAG: HAD family hydrolase [Chloroflexi bacterium]|nr:HAD family hydrolase [Chloroflexota bacterium]
MAEITTVTFDLWQTLLVDGLDLGQARALARLEGAQSSLANFGEDYDLEHIRAAYQSCFQQCREVRDGGLDVDFREQVSIFVDNISPCLSVRLDRETMDEIAHSYADSFLVHPPPAHTDALTVLQGVKDMDLRMGLISNTGMTPGFTFRSYMEERGLLSYFHTLTFSDEVKLSKPSSEIFMMTLRSLGATPEQTIHVGDHVLNDVVAAKRCGLKTVWITGFYEREDPNDPESEPDATVSGLGEVVAAIAKLTGRAVPG